MVIKFIQEQKFLLLLIIIATAIRFSSNIPAIFIDDSVKFYIPLSVIQEHNFQWVLNSISFSHLHKILSYLVQSLDQGSVSNMIVIQKTFAIISTVIFYRIALILTKGKPLISFIGALLFSLNPLMLYIEQLIMPEALFIMLILLTSFLIAPILLNTKPEPNGFMLYIYAAASGISASLFSLTKHSGELWLSVVFIVLILLGAYYAIRHQNFKTLMCFLVFIIACSLVRLPLMLYHLDKHGMFKTSHYSTKGAVIWTLSEEMLLNNPSDKHTWITNTILSNSKLLRMRWQRTGELTDKAKDRAFYSAIAAINVYGREGRMLNPETGVRLNSHQWASIAKEYTLDTVLRNPQSWLKRIFRTSFKNIFLNRNITLNSFRKSTRPGIDHEALQFTIYPFSFESEFDPKLESYKVITGSKEINRYKDDHANHFLVMLGRQSGQAYVIPKDSLSLKLQDLGENLALIKVVGPIFILCLLYFLIYFRRIEFSLFEIYILCNFLFFALLPLSVIGEPRYRLQFMPFMILFPMFVISRILDKNKSN